MSKLKEDLKSPWLWAIIGIISIVVIVNIILIVLSQKYSHSLVVKDSYLKGKKYFHDQNVLQKKSLHGYQLNLKVPDRLKVDTETVIDLQIKDFRNIEMEEQEVILYIYRVNDMTSDFQVPMEKKSEGVYESSVKFPLPGTWDLIGQVIMDGEKVDAAKRVFVQK